MPARSVHGSSEDPKSMEITGKTNQAEPDRLREETRHPPSPERRSLTWNMATGGAADLLNLAETSGKGRCSTEEIRHGGSIERGTSGGWVRCDTPEEQLLRVRPQPRAISGGVLRAKRLEFPLSD